MEQEHSREEEEFSIISEPINGFLHARQITCKSPSTFSYTLDAVNYNPEIEIPKSGEFMLKPEDILENVHFYLHVRYLPDRLNTFSFAYSHYRDILGEFTGRKAEIGSESVMKDFINQLEFKQMYETGSVDYNLGGQDYFFGINKQKGDISFALNGRLFAEIPAKPSKESVNIKIYAPFSRIRR
jgi:hypothetical protein